MVQRATFPVYAVDPALANGRRVSDLIDNDQEWRALSSEAIRLRLDQHRAHAKECAERASEPKS
jgi:hypothetical protein